MYNTHEQEEERRERSAGRVRYDLKDNALSLESMAPPPLFDGTAPHDLAPPLYDSTPRTTWRRQFWQVASVRARTHKRAHDTRVQGARARHSSNTPIYDRTPLPGARPRPVDLLTRHRRMQKLDRAPRHPLACFHSRCGFLHTGPSATASRSTIRQGWG